MKLLIQRIHDATITIDHDEQRSCGRWIIVYIWISKEDTWDFIPKAIERTLNINLFENEDGKLKNSVNATNWDILIVSNFTLYGKNKKWNQLDFTDAGWFQISKEIYNDYVEWLKRIYTWWTIITWEFGAYMEVESRVDGPVNVILEG